MSEEARISAKRTLIVSVSILLVAVLFTVVIFSTEPEAQREAAMRKTAMLVDVIGAERGDFRPVIAAMGTVIPAQEVILQPRVSGQVIRIADNFVPGGRVTRGEVLLQVDPADYRNLLQQRQSELVQAQTALEIEMGEQSVAERDYQQMGNRNLSEMQKALVLREPQLEAARARVEAARAAVAQAELDLARTRIEAPFDAQIVSRMVNAGSQVQPGNNLAELVGVATYWVEATVPLAHLRWLNVGDREPNVIIRNRTAWPEGAFRHGRLHSVIGQLEEQTRMVRVLIEVDDPLAVTPENEGKMPLIVGTFVECRIQGEALRDVVRLPRDYIRKNDTAWVMKNGALEIRPLDIVLLDEQYAYVREGLGAGDQVVTTHLSAVTEGAELRLTGASDG